MIKYKGIPKQRKTEHFVGQKVKCENFCITNSQCKNFASAIQNFRITDSQYKNFCTTKTQCKRFSHQQLSVRKFSHYQNQMRKFFASTIRFCIGKFICENFASAKKPNAKIFASAASRTKPMRNANGHLCKLLTAKRETKSHSKSLF